MRRLATSICKAVLFLGPGTDALIHAVNGNIHKLPHATNMWLLYIGRQIKQ